MKLCSETLVKHFCILWLQLRGFCNFMSQIFVFVTDAVSEVLEYLSSDKLCLEVLTMLIFIVLCVKRTCGRAPGPLTRLKLDLAFIPCNLVRPVSRIVRYSHNCAGSSFHCGLFAQFETDVSSTKMLKFPQYLN